MKTKSSIIPRALKNAAGYIIVGGWSAFSLFFVVWVVLASLKSTRNLFGNPWSVPLNPAFGNYVKTWFVSRFGEYFLNSLLVVSLSVLGLLIVSAPAAYVLSRGKFRGREAISNFIVFGMGVPIPLLFVPLVVLVSALHRCGYIDWSWGDLCLAVRPLHSLCPARIFFVATVGT